MSYRKDRAGKKAVLKDWSPVHRNYVAIITHDALLRPARALTLPCLRLEPGSEVPLFTELPRGLIFSETVYGPVRPYALGPEVWSTWLFPGNRNLPPTLKPGHVEMRHVPGVLGFTGPTKRAHPHHTSQVKEQPSCLRRVYTSLSCYLFHRLPGHVGLMLLVQETQDLGFEIVAEPSARCLHKYLRTKHPFLVNTLIFESIGCAQGYNAINAYGNDNLFNGFIPPCSARYLYLTSCREGVFSDKRRTRRG